MTSIETWKHVTESVYVTIDTMIIRDGRLVLTKGLPEDDFDSVPSQLRRKGCNPAEFSPLPYV